MNWLKQRPWLIVPALGMIPLVSIPLVHQQTSVSEAQVPSLTPILPTTVVSALSVTETRFKQPTPVPQPSPSATPKKAVVAAGQDAKAQSARVQAIQSALKMSADSAIQMRVLIHNGVSSLPINTSAGGDVIDVDSGKPLQQLAPQVGYEAQADGKAIVVGSTQLPSLVWISPAPGGVTYVGDRGYRGQILIAANEGRLWVVNYVNLQQYLYSVVGSEVSPSWPMEALKAQAVAARSYALTYHLKPVKKDLYDLGNDEYFQVYKGIESEAETTRQAVNATGGEFVSYRGGVVESLYAATDDIVMDAFQGHGMSQIGALGLAEQGYSYRQILANYYAGTGVARIEMDIE